MKILVIGCGSIGIRHAANAAHFADVAVFDKDRDRLSKVSEEADTIQFTDFESALDWKPNGVVVATPNHYHLPIATKAVQAGSDILIEKPLSGSYLGVEKFLDLIQQKRKRVFVVCNMRYHPGVRSLQDNIKRIGRPMFARAHVGNYLPNMRPGRDYREIYCAHREQGGGVILDAIHEIDYLMWMLGPVNNVSCTADKLSSLDIDVEDFACLCLRHAQNAISEIQMDYLRPFKRRGCEIVGEKGSLIWESEGKMPEKCRVRFYSEIHKEWEILYETDNVDISKPYFRLMEEFVNAVSGRKTSLLTADVAAQELQVVLTALESSGMLNRETVS